MKKRKKTWLFSLSTLAVGAMLFAGTTSNSALTSKGGVKEQKYFPNYTTLLDAQKAAQDLNVDLSAEGNVLLKNKDNVLPMGIGSYISIFGTNAYAPVGGGVASGSNRSTSVTLADAMESEGFHVNQALVRHYEDQGVSATSGPMSSGGAISDQFNDFDGTVRNSFRSYNDAAIVVIGRNAGEGGDVSRATGERATDDDITSHKSLADYTPKSSTGGEGGFPGFGVDTPAEESYKSKHALMLTEDERDLIKTVKGSFKKVIVLLNTSNVMEVGELKDDDAIQGIIWIGRPGEDGLFGTAKILSGEVNPSGHLVDEWPRDLTADPTWYNFGDNSQVGSTHYYYKTDGSIMCNRPEYGKDEAGNTIIKQGAVSDDWTDMGVDYEEDIYLGYRYYQTYYEDKYAVNPTQANQWYEDNVAYGFGDGLSYTTFSMNIKGVYKNANKTSAVDHSLTSEELSSTDNKANVDKLYIDVEVKNTGSVAGKETVQVYVQAPYTKGGIEKACEDLVGYAKTSKLNPGESETVTVEFNVQDFASWDYNDKNGDGVSGDYELDAGAYTIRVMETSHRDLSVDAATDTTDALDEYAFVIDSTVHQHVDDFSGNKLENLFTTKNGKYTDKYGDSNATIYNSLRTADMMKDSYDPEVLMSRSDFDNTFPEAPKSHTDSEEHTVSGLQFTDEIYNIWQDGDISRLTYHPSSAIDTSSDGIRVNTQLIENDTKPWYITENQVPSTWTQAADKNNRTISLKFKDLNGLDYDDPKYDEFLNQLTWEEVCSLSTESRASTPALDDFGKSKSVDEDGPNDFGNTHEWCCEVTIASTWNKDLAYKEGMINGSISTLMGRTGWYGPGMDMHRSAFSGRNNEYYSQDALQGGYIAAEVVSGARSVGCNPMIKHLAFNDQETNRGGQSLYTWQSEQNIRQYEIKIFQMAIQEGGANSGMSAYGRICGVVNQSNWYLMTGLLQNQFGWHGFMITDGFLGMRWCTTIDLMVRAGNGIVYKTEPWYDTLSGVWDSTMRDGKGDVKYISDETVTDPTYTESWNQYYYARKVAHSVLWATANSANWENGFTETAFNGKSFTGKAGVSSTYECGYSNAELVTLLGDDSSIRYSLEGKLPSGLSFDELTGKISGKTTDVGTYNFKVTATFDNYVDKTANFTLSIASAFTTAEGSDVESELKVGEEAAIQYESDVFTTEGGKYDTVKYSVEKGSLPDGLTISENGIVSGTPTKAGTYEVTFKVVAEKESSGGGMFGMPFPGMGGGTTTEEITFTITFVVAEGDVTPSTEKTTDEKIADLEKEIAGLKEELKNSSSADKISAIEKEIEDLKSKSTSTTYDDTELKAKITALENEIAALKNSTSDDNSSSGCSGSIIAATSAIGAIALVGAGLVLKKKKEDK